MEHHRHKGWVPISAFAFLESIPQKINYLDHLLPYAGSDDDLSIPWGVYGTTSLNACSYYAAHYARAHKRIFVRLTLWYYIEGIGRAKTKLPKSLEECNGMVNMGRIASDLRDEIRGDLLELAATQRAPDHVRSLEALEWAPLLMRDPKLVREYLRRQKNVAAIIHPVSQLFDPHNDEAIQVASFKLRRDRIKMIEATNHSSITVTI